MSDDQLEEARRLAIAENPDNARPVSASGLSNDADEETPAPSPMVSSLDNGDKALSRDEQARLALTHGKKWQVGRTLNIRFLNGSRFVQEKVKRFAREWTYYANIKLDFNDSQNAEIRISFNKGGSYSNVGTDALLVAQNKETMNFGWFDEQTSDEDFYRTTVHEFGHALGCIHEHQNPSVDIPWNKPAVYRYYARTQNPPWDRAKVDLNIFRKHSVDSTQFTQFDRNSIMCYSIPNELTYGNYEVGSNKSMSDKDRSFINQAYPFPDPGPFESGWYRFTNRFLDTGRALDTYSNANNSPFMGTSGRYSGQYWKITPLQGRPGYYRLTNYFLGEERSLDTYSNGNNVPFMGQTGNYSGQMWKFLPTGGGYHRLTNSFLGIGRSLDTYSNANNAPFMGNTGNYSGQHWMITRI
ncbi:M12 family metallopeptidase [Granulosicoccus sp. 3-233]